MTAVLDTALCTNDACLHAWSHRLLCECACGGVGHGKALTALLPTSAPRRVAPADGFTRAMLDAQTDEEW